MECLGVARLIYDYVWSFPLIASFVAVGAYFSFRLGFVQLRGLPQAFVCLRQSQRSKDRGGNLATKSKMSDVAGDISHFASLCTALSATLGTGNIVGIAVALSVGGPGALFWMILSSFFSLATKYGEGVLAVRYRVIRSDGKMAGGPMYVMERGLHRPILAKLFAVFGAGVALVGIGTLAQTNSIAAAVQSFGVPPLVTAVLVGVLVTVVTLGGIQRIADTAEKIVPFMVLLYIGAALILLIRHVDAILPALRLMVQEAFSPMALTGGSVGWLQVMRIGISRGIFCHEAGLGSAAIAAAAAKTKSPVEQGLVSMVGAFVSVAICCITALVLMTTASETQLGLPECPVAETSLTAYAFGVGLGLPRIGQALVHISIVFFAFTSIIGWNYYGEKCVQYLFRTKAITLYRLLFLLFVVVGPFLQIKTAFVVADIVTGLMAIPNLLSLILLRKEIIQETRGCGR